MDYQAENKELLFISLRASEAKDIDLKIPKSRKQLDELEDLCVEVQSWQTGSLFKKLT